VADRCAPQKENRLHPLACFFTLCASDGHALRKKNGNPTTEPGKSIHHLTCSKLFCEFHHVIPFTSKEISMLNNLKSGVALAAAAAALFTTGLATTTVYAADGAVKCSGTNSCKGSSECKTAKSECKGHNSCKGMGWVTAKSADECKKAGGKVVK
jgi:hypothetical protein